MNIKEKLDSFSKCVAVEMEEKRHTLLKEVDTEFKTQCENISAEAQAKASSIINETIYKFEQNKNKEFVEASVEAKKSLFDLRNRLTSRLFDNVLAKLNEYVKTEGYKKALLEDLSGLAAQYGNDSGGFTVSVCKRDMFLKDAIGQTWNIVVIEGGDNIIGGFVAKMNEKNIIIDYSYGSRLEDAKKSFNGFNIG